MASIAENEKRLEDIVEGLALLLTPGCCHEVRVLDVRGGNGRWPYTVSGYFHYDNIPQMAKEILRLNGCGGNAYVTLNPAYPELSARAENHVVERPKHTTSDEEIAARQRLLIDIDPKRRSGIASTNEQHEAALERAQKIRQWLMEGRNWPAPIVMDSGNGAYLIFYTDLPNDEATTRLIKRALKALAQRFDDDVVEIDTSTFNASRIVRVPGTLNRKGDSTATRPHRYAALADVPPVIETVSREQLQQVAGEAAPTDSHAEQPSSVSPECQRVLDELKAQKGITAGEPSPYKDGFKYIPSACPCNPGHNGTSVAIFDFPYRNPPSWGFKCQHTDCKDKHAGDVLDLLGIERPQKQQNSGDSQASRLVKIGRESELYRTPDGKPYARTVVKGLVEDWPTNSKAFKDSLAHAFYQQYSSTPTAQAIKDAIAALDGYARFEGLEHVVDVRVAGNDQCIYLDLANAKRQVVEITPLGWKILSQSPVRFWRPGGMLALPTPVTGGTWDAIKSFINVANDADYCLILSWCVCAMRNNRPFTILDFLGEHGSAKTTAARVARKLIDPYTAAVRALPRSERDLVIAASRCRVLAFDNVSTIDDWLSDAFCRLTTGGGLSTRALHTDSEEVLFDVMRPIVMNGIEQAAWRGDLLDRCLMVETQVIDDSIDGKRKDEDTFWSDFDEAWPQLLGVVLDGVSAALKNLAATRAAMKRKPRMADFAVFATAAELGLGFKDGTFAKAYEINRVWLL